MQRSDKLDIQKKKKDDMRWLGSLTNPVCNTTIHFTRADALVHDCVCALGDHVEAGYALHSAGGELWFDVATCIS